MCLYEPDTGFNSIGFYAALVLNRLRCEAQVRELLMGGPELETDDSGAQEHREPGKAIKPDPEEQNEYVKDRLRQLRQFEQSYQRKGRRGV